MNYFKLLFFSSALIANTFGFSASRVVRLKDTVQRMMRYRGWRDSGGAANNATITRRMVEGTAAGVGAGLSFAVLGYSMGGEIGQLYGLTMASRRKGEENGQAIGYVVGGTPVAFFVGGPLGGVAFLAFTGALAVELESD